MDDTELVGGVLVDTSDPSAAANALAELLSNGTTDRNAAKAAGLDPDLVDMLGSRFRGDPARIERACALASAWVAGRRSVAVVKPWELVASLPAGTRLPVGLRRTTAETLVQLVTQSVHTLRIVAPFIDWPGLSFLADALS